MRKSRSIRTPVRKVKQKRVYSATKDIPDTCRCKCEYFAYITGPEAITVGRTKTYSSNITSWKNPGCKSSTSECKYETKWELITAPPGVSLKDEKKASVKIKVAKNTALRTFRLKATPEGKCHCVGTNAEVKCKSSPDFVYIRLLK